MSARVKRLLLRWIQIATAACLMFAVAFDACAAESIMVLEQHVTEDAVYLYLKYKSADQTAAAQIGTDTAGSAVITDGASIPISTWLVLDNSISISDSDREKAKALLTDLVAGRSANESFTLCTYNDHLNILLQDSQSYADLKSQIDAIVHNNQVSYLTDVLAELLDVEKGREEQAYVRIIVICDGVDENPEGLTREELNKRLAASNVPVYTLGCEKSGNEQLLKELYSLSRQTGAQSWSLSDMSDTLEVVKAMSGDELPICAAVSIPEKLRDGSIKGVQLTFSDGSVAETQAAMPFGAVIEEQEHMAEPTLAPEPEPVPEPEPEFQSSLLLILIAAVFLIVLVIAVVFLLIRRKKKNERIRPVSEELLPKYGETDFLQDQGENSGAGETAILVQDNRRLMLSLSDRANPDRYFEAPLCGRVTIGRNTSNQIVLDYERSISGTHCEIFVDGNTFKLRDLNSSNGTYIDGIRVVDVAEVANGSTIKLGRLEFVVGIR